MKAVSQKNFSETEHRTWKALYQRQSLKRHQQIVPQFSQGLKLLQIDENKIPRLEEVNQRLRRATGWEGVAVEGLEEGESFYSMLAQKKFPVGNFIRDEKDLSYTPAPDIFHDLYGHIPFYADGAYAEFCEEYGKQAIRFRKQPQILREFERFFWFTIEFGLVESFEGRRIFGAGIASSFGECDYALSTRPQILKFDVEAIRHQEFRIDVFQEKLFLLKSVQELYDSLQKFLEPYHGKTHH